MNTKINPLAGCLALLVGLSFTAAVVLGALYWAVRMVFPQ